MDEHHHAVHGGAHCGHGGGHCGHGDGHADHSVHGMVAIHSLLMRFQLSFFKNY